MIEVYENGQLVSVGYDRFPSFVPAHIVDMIRQFIFGGTYQRYGKWEWKWES